MPKSGPDIVTIRRFHLKSADGRLELEATTDEKDELPSTVMLTIPDGAEHEPTRIELEPLDLEQAGALMRELREFIVRGEFRYMCGFHGPHNDFHCPICKAAEEEPPAVAADPIPGTAADHVPEAVATPALSPAAAKNLERSADDFF